MIRSKMIRKKPIKKSWIIRCHTRVIIVSWWELIIDKASNSLIDIDKPITAQNNMHYVVYILKNKFV